MVPAPLATPFRSRWDYKFESGSLQQRVCELWVPERRTGRREALFAITGVMDTDNVTLPVRVATNSNYEHPPIARYSNTRPASTPLTLTVTVSHLTPGISYNLYRYA